MKKRKTKWLKIAGVAGVMALAILAVALIIYFLTDDNDRQEDGADMQVADA